MDSNTVTVLMCFIFFGWIPVLAIGKAVSWIIVALKK